LRMCRDWGSSCLGMVSNEEIAQSNILISPNPVRDYLQVLNLDQGEHHYSIFDQLGRVVSNGIVESDVIVSHLDNGYYWIAIFNDDNSMLSQKAFVKN